LVVAVVFGFRLIGKNNSTLRTYGLILLVLVGIQLLLGGGALIAVLLRSGEAIPVYEVVLTTLHQANGALLLGASVASLAWVIRASSLQ
jgi:heme A synthase